MSRAGDKDEGGQGASVAQISDAPGKRSERPGRRPRPEPSPPDPSPGIELISNLFGDDQDHASEESPDDALDRTASGQRQSAVERPALVSITNGEVDDPAASQGAPSEAEYDGILEQLERHHERGQSSRTGSPLPGSADIASFPHTTVGSRAPRRARHTGSKPRRGRSHRAILSIAVAVTVAVTIAAVVGSMASSSSRSGRHGLGQPASSAVAAVHAGVTAEDVLRATTTFGADLRQKAKASSAAEAKARSRARAVARAKARARRVRADRRRVVASRRVAGSSTVSASTPTPQSAAGTSSPSTTSASSAPAHSSSSARQPAFGLNGSLGPGSSSNS